MTTIAATTSSNYATPVRTLEPTKNREAHSTTDALLELTRAAHRAISSAEGVATAIAPAAASVSAGLAAALWNLDSGASMTTTTTPALEMSASVEPEAASNLETEVLKALAQALGVDEAA